METRNPSFLSKLWAQYHANPSSMPTLYTGMPNNQQTNLNPSSTPTLYTGMPNNQPRAAGMPNPMWNEWKERPILYPHRNMFPQPSSTPTPSPSANWKSGDPVPDWKSGDPVPEGWQEYRYPGGTRLIRAGLLGSSGPAR